MKKKLVSAPVLKIIVAHPSDIFCKHIAAKVKRWNHNFPPLKAYNAKEVVDFFKEEKVDIIFLHDHIVGINGQLFYKELLQQFPLVKIILLSEKIRPGYFRHAARNGVKGFVNHLTQVKIIKKALMDVMKGHLYYCPVIREYLQLSSPLLSLLTLRETEVYHLDKNYTNKEIAAILNIEPESANKYRKRIFKKGKAAGYLDEVNRLKKKHIPE